MARFTSRKYAHLKTQEDAFMHFMQCMDIEMIGAILEDHLTYQDFPKWLFINKLDTALEEFRRFGDSKLTCDPGECNSCERGCKGISFIGNKTYNYLDLIIKSLDGRIEDIFECAEFKNDDSTVRKTRRIFIDRVMPID